MKTLDGISILKEKLKNVPDSPGVYRMLNDKGDILYVGKAKNLKNRLTNYTQENGLTNRIRRMVFETRDLIVVETKTEAEALLLEISLIKSLKPKFNITFRDDTTYPYILITDEESPMIRSFRGARKQSGEYFGPYPGAGAVHKTVDLVERVFKLRTCKPSVFNNRTRPCLKFDIKRCSAPCVSKISENDYKDTVQQAKMFLHGKTQEVQKHIRVRMEEASNDMRYEDAANERDRLQALMDVAGKSSALTHGFKDADVFGVFIEGGKACVLGYFYRGGVFVGTAHWYPKGVEDLDASEVLKFFLAMHYESKQPPKEIYTAYEPDEVENLSDALSLKTTYKVTIQSPKRGEKRRVLNQATENARNTLLRKQAESAGWNKQMKAFADILSLETVNRIECFDISNISGTNPVASLVVAGEEGMLKSDYRKFSIKTKNTPDDYAMMHEALTRRYGRLKKEQSKFPDVVMVDGGKGHLTTLIKTFDDLDLLDTENCPVLCCIAKGPERDKGLEVLWRYGTDEELPIEYNSPLKFMLQRVRDESHRFAINFHRQKRSKGVEKSVLDSIPNVGGKRKKALLLHFGSAEGVKGADVGELTKVDGISKALAQHIYDFLHG